MVDVTLLLKLQTLLTKEVADKIEEFENAARGCKETCLLEGYDHNEILAFRQKEQGRMVCGQAFLSRNGEGAVSTGAVVVYHDPEFVVTIIPKDKRTDWSKFPLVRCLRQTVKYRPGANGDDAVDMAKGKAVDDMAFAMFKFAHDVSRLEGGKTKVNWSILDTPIEVYRGEVMFEMQCIFELY